MVRETEWLWGRECARAHLKMAAFPLWPELAREVNRHFLTNEHGDLSFLFSVLDLSNDFLSVK